MSKDEVKRIVQMILDGQAIMYQRLYDGYIKLVLSCLRSLLRNEADVEELAQETFLRAYEKLHLFNPSYEFSTWIYKIAMNIGLDYIRKKRYQLECLSEEAQLACYLDNDHLVENIEAQYIKKEEQQLLFKEVSRLPKRYRDVIVLYYYANQRQKQISEILEIPLGTVHSRMNVGKKKLAKSIGKQVQ